MDGVSGESPLGGNIDYAMFIKPFGVGGHPATYGQTDFIKVKT